MTILCLKRCFHCDIFIDEPRERRFCPFCGNEVVTGKRQELTDLFDEFGPDLGMEHTYVQVIPRPEGNDKYAVIGDTERLDRRMKWLQAA